MLLCFSCSSIGSYLCCIGRRFSWTFKTFRPSWWPRNYVSAVIGYRNNSIIKSRINKSYTCGNIFFNFFFSFFYVNWFFYFFYRRIFFLVLLSLLSLFSINYFLSGVSFFPAIAIALPFLVLALQCVLCPLTGNFFLCLEPLYVAKSTNLFLLRETSLRKSPSTL